MQLREIGFGFYVRNNPHLAACGVDALLADVEQSDIDGVGESDTSGNDDAAVCN